METEYDKFEREKRELDALKGDLVLIAFGIVLVGLAFVGLLVLIGWLAVEYNDILLLKNGNI